MDIKQIYEGINPYQNKKTGKGESPGAASRSGKSSSSGESSSSDRISLSDDAKLFSQAVKDAQSEADVRAAKVAELKAKVASGEYQPDSKVIAEKLLLSEADFL